MEHIGTQIKACILVRKGGRLETYLSVPCNEQRSLLYYYEYSIIICAGTMSCFFSTRRKGLMRVLYGTLNYLAFDLT
jgi:hypothetical protein